MKRASDFFSGNEREMIRQAVHAAESSTTGEIATMVVDESDSYRDAVVIGSVLLAALLAVVIAILFHHVTIWFYIPLVFLLFFPCRALFVHVPALKLPLLSRTRINLSVRERAVRAFYEKGLHRTRDATGILIFISLLEHKVWILGDRGIDSKIPSDSWQGLAQELVAGLRENRAGDVLCTVVTKCGAALKEHFPRVPDDLNELPDDVITP
jgi:putative membrane protein